MKHRPLWLQRAEYIHGTYVQPLVLLSMTILVSSKLYEKGLMSLCLFYMAVVYSTAREWQARPKEWPRKEIEPSTLTIE